MKFQPLLPLLLLLAWAPSELLASNKADCSFGQIQLPASQLMRDLKPAIQLDTYLSPSEVSKLKPKFDIYTRAVPHGIKMEFVCGEVPLDRWELGRAKLNTSAPTVLIIPGYQIQERMDWTYKIASRWRMLNEDANVVVINWRVGSGTVYSGAVANTPLVGRQITIFLAYLAEASGTTLDDADFVGRIQLVGHSLGAQIAGFVGQDLQGRVGRIVGLDPAGPSFDQMPKEHRLSKEDAKLVQVLHTNSGKMNYAKATAGGLVRVPDMLVHSLPFIGRVRDALTSDYAGDFDTAWYGIDLQVGHMDYYANGGRKQPGCDGIMHVCDHRRAYELYTSLLERQIALANSSSARESIPMTFYARDYAQYLREGPKHAKCLQKGPTDPEGCGVPLDLVGANEHLLELPLKSEKLFFQTNGADPFIGEHYLLQAELVEEISWRDSCALVLNFTFADGQVSTVAINKQLETADKNLLAISFVGPQMFSSLKLLELAMGGAKELPMKASDQQAEWIRRSLPTQVSMSITSSKATKISEAAAKTIAKGAEWISGGRLSSQPSELCSLVMTSWEIHALVSGLRRSIGGVYEDKSTGYRLQANRTNRSDLPELHLQPPEKTKAVRYLTDVIFV